MVTSVYRTAQARRDAFAVGADAFLLEPIAPEQLVRTIEGLLNRRTDVRPVLTEAWLVTDAIGNIVDLSVEATKLLKQWGEGEPQTYIGLPGQWSGVPFDFVTGGGEGGSGQPGLPSEVTACLAGT